MKEIRAIFSLPTKFVGVAYDEEVSMEVDESLDDSEIADEVFEEFKIWFNGIISDLWQDAEYEILEEYL